ncbi:hypothetical protein [Roseibium sp.]|uniref:hypothetical protein n=1 Tax=Roseibium sp. TaxID=1936156 RepID=UPI003B52CA2D
MKPEDVVSLCAQNNALWCDAVLKAAGAQTGYHHGYWQALGATVPLFPNIVTVTDDHGADLTSALAVLPANAAVKDSFNCLNLRSLGFEELLTGTWLFRMPQSSRKPPAPPSWHKAVTVESLRKWLEGWSDKEVLHKIFPAKLLEVQAIDFASILQDSTLKAGAALNHGPACDGKNIIGVSNVFRRKSWLFGALHDLLEPYPHRPVCTYETDDELLPVYRQLGFEEVGKLTVWRKL